MLSKLSMKVFDNVVAGRVVGGPLGFHQLANPIMIRPEVPIEMLIRLGAATPPSTLIETVFYGASTLAT